MSVPNGHTYPLRCFAPQWARFDNRHSTSAPTPTLTAVSGSGKLCWHSRGNDNDQENAGYVRESAGGSEQA